MITYDMATNLQHGRTLYHITEKNADGSVLRCRVTGKCKTWVTRPGQFCLPVKHGLRTSFYIENSNAQEWRLTEHAPELNSKFRRIVRVIGENPGLSGKSLVERKLLPKNPNLRSAEKDYGLIYWDGQGWYVTLGGQAMLDADKKTADRENQAETEALGFEPCGPNT
jgi:hypothetical protein